MCMLRHLIWRGAGHGDRPRCHNVSDHESMLLLPIVDLLVAATGSSGHQ